MIYLYHNELSGELCADYNYKSEFTETYIRKYEGDYKEECIIYYFKLFF